MLLYSCVHIHVAVNMCAIDMGDCMNVHIAHVHGLFVYVQVYVKGLFFYLILICDL